MTKHLDQVAIKAAIDSTNNMLEAAAFMNVQFSTFKRYASKYGLYAPNPARGRPAGFTSTQKYSLEDILARSKKRI